MPRRLLLVRHAKALHGGQDRQRPLDPRGFADARALGRWLAEQGLFPERVLVSPALRTLQTWESTVVELGGPEAVSVEERVYAATVEDLLQLVRETDAGVQLLAVVGHNPSVRQLAVLLDDGRGDAAAREALADGYPTAAATVLAVGEWAALGEGAGTVLAFHVGRAVG